MREKNSRPDKILGSNRKPPSAATAAKGNKKGAGAGNKPSKAKYAPKSNHSPSNGDNAEEPADAAERARQQVLLDVFSSTFDGVLRARDFNTQLQDLKAALFARDFEAAFAREAALDVYAARWSPTRALCYGRVLRGLTGHLKGRDDVSSSSSSRGQAATRRRRGSNGQTADDNGEDDDGVSRNLDKDISEIQEGISDVKLEARDESPAATTMGKELESSRETRKSEEANGTDAPNTSKDKDSDEQRVGEEREEEENKKQTLRVLAIGGAAAEIVAFADYVSDSGMAADITLLDVGPWGSVVGRLHASLLESSPPSLVTATDFKVDFTQRDILSVQQEELKSLLSGRPSTSTSTAASTSTSTPLTPSPIAAPAAIPNNPILITLLFTLNELYTTGGIKLTTTFLRSLTAAAAPGTLLLVVDSPGSYSEAAVGKEARKYPMQWLLDHTLLTSSSASSASTGSSTEEGGEALKGHTNNNNKWRKIESSDSTWFRLPEGLRYPIQLENMRYQLHLYRYC